MGETFSELKKSTSRCFGHPKNVKINKLRFQSIVSRSRSSYMPSSASSLARHEEVASSGAGAGGGSQQGELDLKAVTEALQKTKAFLKEA